MSSSTYFRPTWKEYNIEVPLNERMLYTKIFDRIQNQYINIRFLYQNIPTGFVLSVYDHLSTNFYQIFTSIKRLVELEKEKFRQEEEEIRLKEEERLREEQKRLEEKRKLEDYDFISRSNSEVAKEWNKIENELKEVSEKIKKENEIKKEKIIENAKNLGYVIKQVVEKDNKIKVIIEKRIF